MDSKDTEKAYKRLSYKLRKLYDGLCLELEPMTKTSGRKQTLEKDFINRLRASLRPYFTWGLFTGEKAPIGPSPTEVLEKLSREETAILGFAFGMTKEGRPGKSNEDIARVVKSYLKYAKWNMVFVQWEIADALKNNQIPRDHVAWPPLFKSSEIKNSGSLAKKLHYSEDPMVAHVYRNLPENTKNAISRWAGWSRDENLLWLADVLVYGLNDLLHKPKFHLGIPEWVELPQLKRDLSYEVRELPHKKNELGKENKLGQGQAIRVNRFILESLFPEELAPGEYLSSVNVLEKVMGKIKSAGIKNVIVVANPGHMYRCYELVHKVGSDMHVNPEVYIADCTKVRYDRNSAQSWTRSPLAFWEYDILSRSREVVLKQILDEWHERK